MSKSPDTKKKTIVRVKVSSLADKSVTLTPSICDDKGTELVAMSNLSLVAGETLDVNLPIDPATLVEWQEPPSRSTQQSKSVESLITHRVGKTGVVVHETSEGALYIHDTGYGAVRIEKGDTPELTETLREIVRSRGQARVDKKRCELLQSLIGKQCSIMREHGGTEYRKLIDAGATYLIFERESDGDLIVEDLASVKEIHYSVTLRGPF